MRPITLWNKIIYLAENGMFNSEGKRSGIIMVLLLYKVQAEIPGVARGIKKKMKKVWKNDDLEKKSLGQL